MLGRNPADAVNPPVPKAVEMRVLNEEQLVRLFDLLRESPLWVPTILAGTCGMRRGEILALRWSDVHLDTSVATASITQTLEQVGSEIAFKEPKTQKSRRAITLPAMTRDVLRQHRAKQAEARLMLGPAYQDLGLVCSGPDGSPWVPDRLSAGFASFMKGADLPRIRFHDLRHTHATHLLRAGVHPKIVSERLGHSTITITLDTYSHVLPGMQEEAAERIDQALRQAIGSEKPPRM
jgi:integrase